MTKPKDLTPICHFEDLASDDLLDALRSVDEKSDRRVWVRPPGVGVDALISWAVQQVEQARCTTGAERDRLNADAVVNARRALACMVDWYLTRDGFDSCFNAPSSASEKAEVLRKRGVVDELTLQVLARAVDLRNNVEHRYHAPSLEEAQDLVELFRRTVLSLHASNPPDVSPCVFGVLHYGGMEYRKGETTIRFFGWARPAIVFSARTSIPWVGVVIPDSDVNAVVRRCLLKNIDRNILSEVHRIFDSRQQSSGATTSQELWELVLNRLGLDRFGDRSSPE